ncbi:hypothetical protein BBK82_31690 [Lentzea guizhouensis]|uniref:SnoaL-like domain-containing protein n=1 Tax=Lentzea guizhouensis TaxID=1586287 RepID=A0A1B2HQD1_9PSEU|nr:nuclear transport factor 2 family protein [Lentzea guizhouensis]ANZ39928.1 hypothetical protein BBK82_31690 [Lentzea guizhouensis]
MRALVATLPEGFHYELARVIADGDLVALHGVHHGFGPEPLVAFDLFRVENGKLAEHWDALTPVVQHTASGRSQTDGPVLPAAVDTERSRALVREFGEQVACWDLFRVADGKIVEHWDVITPVPARLSTPAVSGH